MCVSSNSVSDRDLAASWVELETDAERLAEELSLRSECCCGRCAEGIEGLAGTAGALAARIGEGVQ